MSIKVFLFGSEHQTQAMNLMFAQAEDIEVVGSSEDENTVLEDIRRMNADVLMTYIDGSGPVYRVTQQVYMLCPQCINFSLTSKRILERESARIIQNGIQYIYEDTIGEEELIAYIKNANTVEKNRKSALEEGKFNMTTSKVYTFYSPKEGMGKSTFVINYAVELAKRKKNVIVLDLDLQFGDINILTNIESKETIAEMLQERSNPTIDTIRQYVTYHKSGVNILCAPRNLEYAEKINSQQIEKIITALRSYYDFILIDAPSTFGELAYACFEQSNGILIAVRPDISSLNHAKKAITVLEAVGQKDRISLLCFDFMKKLSIDEKKIEAALGIPVWLNVPYDYKVAVEALNQGEPIATMYPKSALAKTYSYAADMLVKPGKANRRGRRKK